MRAALAGALLLAAGAAAAQEAVPDPAIGRANQSSFRRVQHCTAFAIAPRVAVTARHCLRNFDDGLFQVLFGYARMEWAGRAKVERFVPLGRDVAALCLREEAPGVLPAGPVPAEGDTVRVVGYGAPRSHLPNEAACAVTGVGRDSILLDCPQSPGASGGPLLDAAGRAVGVVSATTEELSVAGMLPEGAAGACS